MNKVFSITIECDEKGQLSYFTQTNMRLTQEQQHEFNELKKTVDRIVKPAMQTQIKFEHERKEN